MGRRMRGGGRGRRGRQLIHSVLLAPQRIANVDGVLGVYGSTELSPFVRNKCRLIGPFQAFQVCPCPQPPRAVKHLLGNIVRRQTPVIGNDLPALILITERDREPRTVAPRPQRRCREE